MDADSKQASQMESLEVRLARDKFLKIIRQNEDNIKQMEDLIVRLQSELKSLEGQARELLLETLKSFDVTKGNLEKYNEEVKKKLEELGLEFLRRSSPEGPAS